MSTQHTAIPWLFARTASGHWRVQDVHGYLIVKTQKFADAEYITRACNLHERTQLLIKQFGNATIAMFAQMERGRWRDEHGDDVSKDRTVTELMENVLEAIILRTTYSDAAHPEHSDNRKE